MIGIIGTGIAAGIVAIGVIAGIRVVRPTEVGIVERLGKYQRTAQQGFHWIIPIIDQMYRVNMTEIRADVPSQEVITKDNLNARVDAVVYYRVKNAKKALYNVNNFHRSIVSLARTTLRAAIGNMTLAKANEERSEINSRIETEMSNQIEKADSDKEGWGVDIVRVELQEITPPGDVQDAMNKVVKAEKEKIAAIDLATAIETKADGEKRAEIKKAEGVARGVELKAKADAEAVKMKAAAEAEAIKLVNESANKYFKGNAQILKKLDTVEGAFKKGTKLIIDSKSKVSNIVSELAGVPVVPTKEK